MKTITAFNILKTHFENSTDAEISAKAHSFASWVKGELSNYGNISDTTRGKLEEFLEYKSYPFFSFDAISAVNYPKTNKVISEMDWILQSITKRNEPYKRLYYAKTFQLFKNNEELYGLSEFDFVLKNRMLEHFPQEEQPVDTVIGFNEYVNMDSVKNFFQLGGNDIQEESDEFSHGFTESKAYVQNMDIDEYEYGNYSMDRKVQVYEEYLGEIVKSLLALDRYLLRTYEIERNVAERNIVNLKREYFSKKNTYEKEIESERARKEKIAKEMERENERIRKEKEKEQERITREREMEAKRLARIEAEKKALLEKHELEMKLIEERKRAKRDLKEIGKTK